jgi:selenocysteine lyase/cysteine desulfurase
LTLSAGWPPAAGAQVFLDAVHYAPHGLLDVRDWGCDYLACSAYKFFGPHVGLLWGRRELLEELPAYKVRPAPDTIPGRWMTGTPNLEGIAGTLAAVGYLAGLGGWDQKRPSDLRPALRRAYQLIESYERDLCRRLLEGLARLPAIKVWGVTDLNRFAERVPTVGLTHARLTATHLAAALAERGVFVWHGNFYALALTERLGLEPEGMVRIGLLHYNTAEEVDRLLDTLAEFS